MVSTSSASRAAALPSGDTPQDRPRRFRTSKPKVKTGCNSCKQRRIKCDELRPACTQCVRSKKICTGYPPPPRAKVFEEVRIAPKPGAGHVSRAPVVDIASDMPPLRSRLSPFSPPQPPVAKPIYPRESPKKLTPPQTPVESSLTIHRPSMFSFDPQEGLYFQLFRERTASELSGFFDSSFWTRSVLQECHSEEAIRHAVVALGALYKTLEKMSESPPSSPSNRIDQTDSAMRHWEVAFRNYSLAINTVVNSFSQDASSQRTSLMASVLLACFDSFIGDHKQAINQIQSGLRLLETLRAQRRNSFLPSLEEPVEQDLVQMFTRLAIQAKSYDMAFHFPQPYVIRLTPQNKAQPASPSSDGGSPVPTGHPQLPDKFLSLIEARQAWDTLCERMMRFTEGMFSYTTERSPMGVLPNSLKQYGMGFAEGLETWSKAFEPILISRNAPAKSSQEKTAIAVLKMNQIMGEILFYMTFSDTELQFDAYLSRFQEIVNLAEEVVGDEERRAAAKRCPNPHFCHHQPSTQGDFGEFGQYAARHIKPSFSADLGIVPPLFVVATKCRDPLTRRKAIHLLRTSARREAMWDSELVARIGSWIADIEEEEDETDDTGYPISSSTEMSGFSMGSSRARASASPSFGGDIPLGPGGNARWGSRRESVPLSPHKSIPEEKRVMVRAVEFDLRERRATLQCGTRGLPPGMRDPRTRSTRIKW